MSFFPVTPSVLEFTGVVGEGDVSDHCFETLCKVPLSGGSVSLCSW